MKQRISPRRRLGGLRVGAAALLMLAGAAPVAAQDRGRSGSRVPLSEPAQEVQAAVEEVLSILRNPENQGAAARMRRVEAIRGVADRHFDWQEMARRSLGVHWRKLSPPQRQRFTKTFEQILANTYIDDFDRFSGDEEVVVEDGEKIGDHWVVKTTLITHSREQVPINYYMQQRDGRWLVHDFSVEGISQVNHYRNSFSRYLVNHSFDELMQRLERQVGAAPGT